MQKKCKGAKRFQVLTLPQCHMLSCAAFLYYELYNNVFVHCNVLQTARQVNKLN